MSSNDQKNGDIWDFLEPFHKNVTDSLEEIATNDAMFVESSILIEARRKIESMSQALNDIFVKKDKLDGIIGKNENLLANFDATMKDLKEKFNNLKRYKESIDNKWAQRRKDSHTDAQLFLSLKEASDAAKGFGDCLADVDRSKKQINDQLKLVKQELNQAMVAIENIIRSWRDNNHSIRINNQNSDNQVPIPPALGGPTYLNNISNGDNDNSNSQNMCSISKPKKKKKKNEITSIDDEDEIINQEINFLFYKDVVDRKGNNKNKDAQMNRPERLAADIPLHQMAEMLLKRVSHNHELYWRIYVRCGNTRSMDDIRKRVKQMVDQRSRKLFYIDSMFYFQKQKESKQNSTSKRSRKKMDKDKQLGSSNDDQTSIQSQEETEVPSKKRRKITSGKSNNGADNNENSGHTHNISSINTQNKKSNQSHHTSQDKKSRARLNNLLSSSGHTNSCGDRDDESDDESDDDIDVIDGYSNHKSQSASSNSNDNCNTYTRTHDDYDDQDDDQDDDQGDDPDYQPPYAYEAGTKYTQKEHEMMADELIQMENRHVNNNRGEYVQSGNKMTQQQRLNRLHKIFKQCHPDTVKNICRLLRRRPKDGVKRKLERMILGKCPGHEVLLDKL